MGAIATPIQVAIDCADPRRLAEFWATALGYVFQPPPDGYNSWEEFLAARGIPAGECNSKNAVVDPAGAGPRVFFQRVPEGKTVKNRVHLDLYVGGPRDAPEEERHQRIDAEVDRLVAAGASVVGEVNQWGERWVVLRYPEGNELCVV